MQVCGAGLTLVGGIEDVVSPVLHLRLTKPAADADAAETTLQVGLPVLRHTVIVVCAGQTGSRLEGSGTALPATASCRLLQISSKHTVALAGHCGPSVLHCMMLNSCAHSRPGVCIPPSPS